MKKIVFNCDRGYIFLLGNKRIFTDIRVFNKNSASKVLQSLINNNVIKNININDESIQKELKNYGGLYDCINIVENPTSQIKYNYSTRTSGGGMREEDFLIIEI